ncbi:unnamed protein product [Musa acuminata subsp. malaccensis]|uniref:(wild Malaysian banana) hypothetical protein n=1 Tax=Musa acuminata subsp. malaccensis TaxID=214687 RepID=A0A8D7FJJ1_MUSAM|nr:unnamed protein product [Musa acuminata subsp. malaccensis]
MFSSFGLWFSCISCLATSILGRPSSLLSFPFLQAAELRTSRLFLCFFESHSITGEVDRGVLLLPARRGTRRSDESAAEGDAPGQNPAWLRDRAEKQFAGNRVLHPIPDTGVSPTGNDQHTAGIEEIVEAAMTNFLSRWCPHVTIILCYPM